MRKRTRTSQPASRSRAKREEEGQGHQRELVTQKLLAHRHQDQDGRQGLRSPQHGLRQGSQRQAVREEKGGRAGDREDGQRLCLRGEHQPD